jgi:hypothetical protein
MRIDSIRVKGFRNFRQPVSLEELTDINVLHGENNTGKSNLIDAIELAFALLGDLAMHQWPDRQMEKLLGLRPIDVFPVEAQEGSVEIVLRVSLDPAEGEHIADTTGTLALRSGGSVEIELLLARSANAFRWNSSIKPSYGRNTDAVVARTIKRGAPPYKDDSCAFLSMPSLRSAYGGAEGRDTVPQGVLAALLDSHDARDAKSTGCGSASRTSSSLDSASTSERASFARGTKRGPSAWCSSCTRPTAPSRSSVSAEACSA